MVELEAAGEVVGGALAGRAVEPVPDGHGGEKIPGPGDCLNCATPLEGHHYCHHCGQNAHVHRTLAGLAHDFVHGILHFDGKFWRTLPMIVTAPGELTRRYVRGQRARFISPIAVYLFSVVAMFAFVVSIGTIDPGEVTVNTNQADTVEEQQQIIDDLEASLADLDDKDFPGVSGVRAGVRSEIGKAERHLAKLEGREEGSSADNNVSLFDTEVPGLQDEIDKIEANPSLYLYKVQTKAYKLSWLLIPLSLPFMWLLFPFSRKYRMYDHAVFVTYSISFMMLLTLFVAGLAAIFGANDWLAWALLVPPVHMYRQLRGAYDLSRKGAILRAFLLTIFAGVVMLIFSGIMLALGAL